MINNSEDLKGVARKIVWFDQPDQVLGNTQYFLTYVMNYGTDEDLTVVRKYYSDADGNANALTCSLTDQVHRSQNS
jgi:hypothetical protein